MRIYYPSLRNMTHSLSIEYFIAFKGTYFNILFTIRKFMTSSLSSLSFICLYNSLLYAHGLGL